MSTPQPTYLEISMTLFLALISIAACLLILKHRLTEWQFNRKQRKESRRFAAGVQYARDLLAGRLDADVSMRMGMPFSDIRLNERLVYIKAKLEESAYLGHSDAFDRAIEQLTSSPA